MKFHIVFLLLVYCLHTQAQEPYSVDVTKVTTDVLRGHLDLGGRNPKGDTIGGDNGYNGTHQLLA